MQLQQRNAVRQLLSYECNIYYQGELSPPDIMMFDVPSVLHALRGNVCARVVLNPPFAMPLLLGT